MFDERGPNRLHVGTSAASCAYWGGQRGFQCDADVSQELPEWTSHTELAQAASGALLSYCAAGVKPGDLRIGLQLLYYVRCSESRCCQLSSRCERHH